MIVGHGSRYEYNKKIMELQKERLEKMGFENVYIGFNETSHPFIGETMEQMAADGIEEVVAIPFFIASGLHMTRDIPPKLGLKDDCKDMVVSVDGHEMMMHFGEPFGEDPLLAKILGEKIDEAKKCKRTGVLVIGHGSKLHYNKDIISLNAKRLTDMGYDETIRIRFIREIHAYYILPTHRILFGTRDYAHVEPIQYVVAKFAFIRIHGAYQLRIQG